MRVNEASYTSIGNPYTKAQQAKAASARVSSELTSLYAHAVKEEQQYAPKAQDTVSISPKALANYASSQMQKEALALGYAAPAESQDIMASVLHTPSQSSFLDEAAQQEKNPFELATTGGAGTGATGSPAETQIQEIQKKLRDAYARLVKAMAAAQGATPLTPSPAKPLPPASQTSPSLTGAEGTAPSASVAGVEGAVPMPEAPQMQESPSQNPEVIAIQAEIEMLTATLVQLTAQSSKGK